MVWNTAIRLVRKAGEKFTGGSGGAVEIMMLWPGYGAVFAIFVIVCAYNSFYTVDIEEEAVVTRLVNIIDGSTRASLQIAIHR